MTVDYTNCKLILTGGWHNGRPERGGASQALPEEGHIRRTAASGPFPANLGQEIIWNQIQGRLQHSSRQPCRQRLIDEMQASGERLQHMASRRPSVRAW